MQQLFSSSGYYPGKANITDNVFLQFGLGVQHAMKQFDSTKYKKYLYQAYDEPREAPNLLYGEADRQRKAVLSMSSSGAFTPKARDVAQAFLGIQFGR